MHTEEVSPTRRIDGSNGRSIEVCVVRGFAVLLVSVVLVENVVCPRINEPSVLPPSSGEQNEGLLREIVSSMTLDHAR